jgi:hypothetical protein
VGGGRGAAWHRPRLSHPARRRDRHRPPDLARALGVYRLWRDAGFAVGALLSGLVADAYGIPAAIFIVAGLTAASGTIVAIRMYETNGVRHDRAVGPSPFKPALACSALLDWANGVHDARSGPHGSKQSS